MAKLYLPRLLKFIVGSVCQTQTPPWIELVFVAAFIEELPVILCAYLVPNFQWEHKCWSVLGNH